MEWCAAVTFLPLLSVSWTIFDTDPFILSMSYSDQFLLNWRQFLLRPILSVCAAVCVVCAWCVEVSRGTRVCARNVVCVVVVVCCDCCVLSVVCCVLHVVCCMLCVCVVVALVFNTFRADVERWIVFFFFPWEKRVVFLCSSSNPPADLSLPSVFPSPVAFSLMFFPPEVLVDLWSATISKPERTLWVVHDRDHNFPRKSPREGGERERDGSEGIKRRDFWPLPILRTPFLQTSRFVLTPLGPRNVGTQSPPPPRPPFLWPHPSDPSPFGPSGPHLSEPTLLVLTCGPPPPSPPPRDPPSIPIWVTPVPTSSGPAPSPYLCHNCVHRHTRTDTDNHKTHTHGKKKWPKSNFI